MLWTIAQLLTSFTSSQPEPLERGQGQFWLVDVVDGTCVDFGQGTGCEGVTSSHNGFETSALRPSSFCFEKSSFFKHARDTINTPLAHDLSAREPPTSSVQKHQGIALHSMALLAFAIVKDSVTRRLEPSWIGKSMVFP